MPHLRCPLCRHSSKANWRPRSRVWTFTCPLCGRYEIENTVYERVGRAGEKQLVGERGAVSRQVSAAWAHGDVVRLTEARWRELTAGFAQSSDEERAPHPPTWTFGRGEEQVRIIRAGGCDLIVERREGADHRHFESPSALLEHQVALERHLAVTGWSFVGYEPERRRNALKVSHDRRKHVLPFPPRRER